MDALQPGADCATLLTRVEVDPKDPAFEQPTKPIGPVYTADEAKLVRAKHLWSMVGEASGGLRLVVPSHLPVSILTIARIRLLVHSEVCGMRAGGSGDPGHAGQGWQDGGRRGRDRQGPHSGLAGADAGCGFTFDADRCGGGVPRLGRR